MNIIFTKRFVRMHRKLSAIDRKRVHKTLKLFEKSPFDPALENHKPHGKLKSTRSISAGYDLRILYREEGKHTTVFMLKVGSHDQVYRD